MDPVSQWGVIFDELYGEETLAADPTFNVSGWRSTATGEPLPEAEMREWLDDTVSRILSLEPRRALNVLEIGCGTGLILFRVAPRCTSYLGTDVSARALAAVQTHLASLPQVRLEHRPADRFDGIADGSLDLVILNSVVQYFPDLEYLERVLTRAVRAVRPGGAIFLGDLRSRSLLPAFYAWVERARAGGDLEPEELAARVRERARRETELAVDPDFFAALQERLPAIGRIDVHPKRCRARNELTLFRYQVVLRIGEAEDRSREVRWVEGLEELEEAEGGVVGMRGPHPLAPSPATPAPLPGRGGTPAEIVELAEALGWEAEFGWASLATDGRIDIVLRRKASGLFSPLPGRGAGVAGEGPGVRALAAWLPRPLPSPEAPRPWSSLEHHRVLIEWNDTAAPLEADCVHRQIWEQASETPDAPALAAGGAVLSYRRLTERAGRLAALLREIGVGPGVRVALCFEYPVDVITSVLAVWRAGGAYVPLDPSLPAARLSFFLADSGAAVLLTRGGLPAGADPAGTRAVDLERETARLAGLDPAPDGGAEDWDLAYLIYTSGTTGTPKAVLVEHGQLANTLLGVCRLFGFGPGDAMPSLAPSSFDIFLFETIAPLLAGGRVLPFTRRQVLDLPVLAAELEAATLLHAVPSLLRQILGAMRERGADRYPRLRRIFVGGDRVPPDLLDKARALLPRTAVTVLYGPTETAILASSVTLDGAIEAPLLGRPLPNVEMRIADSLGEPVPAGVAGEVWIGGAGVARGYHGRPDLTAERWVPAESGRRFYRTGDLGRCRPEGTIEFLGRIDHQVKLRGFRVELGEIEAVLRRHPSVDDAAVVLQEGEDWRLVAYVVGPVSDLRAWLAERLPEYMVPATFVEIEALPLTPHGKVDRRALAQRAPEMATDAPVEPPRSPAEELLVGVFREVLGTERIGVRDGFLALGGHSLLATRVVLRVRQTFGVQLPLRRLLEGASAAELAPELEAAQRGAPLPPVVPFSREAPLELSFGQQRLWFLDRLAPGSAAYNFPFALRLLGPLNLHALRRTFDEVVARHEVLRTSFPTLEDRPVQAVAPVGPWPLPLIDCSGLPDPQIEAERWIAIEGARPFDLARGPLFRTMLVRTGREEHVLLVSNHHAVFDDWSAALLASEVAALYGAFAAGRPSPLPPLPVQYADFAAWQRAWLSGERAEQELDWWRGRLAGIDIARIPPDRPRGMGPSRADQRTMEPLPAAVARGLRDLSRKEGATLFMTLLAAFHGLLHRWTGARTVTVGTPVANRHHAATEDLIGFFVNTLAVPLDLSGDPPFRELVRRSREAALGAWAHQDLPFERIVEALQPDRRAGLQPLFQAMFSLRRPWPDLDLPGLSIRPLEVQRDQAAPFDLSVSLEEGEDGLIGGAEFDAGLFDPATVDALLADFRRLLEAVAADPDLLLSALPVRGDERRLSAATETAAPARPLVEADAAEEERLRSRVAARREGLSGAKKALLSRLLKGKGKDEPNADTIPRRPAGEPPPLSFGQERLWFLEQLEPGTAAYNMLFPLRLRGPLAPGPLAAALTEVLRRHEVLRASFPLVDGRPVQTIAPPCPVRLPILDLAALPEPLRDEEVRRLTAEELERPFDLVRGPVVRLALLRLEEADHLLLWNAHHIAFDGWSLGLLLRELAAIHGGQTLPEPSIQYSDFAAWQRARLQGELLERHLAWWRERLAGAPGVLDLPTDRPRPLHPTYRGGQVQKLLPRRLADRLGALARGEDATLFMLLTAALAAVLGRLAGQDDLLLGTPAAGRPRAETEGLIGFFLDTLVLRADLRGDVSKPASFRTVLRRVREMALGAFAHQELPFEKLVEELAPRRDLTRTPFFQVFFNLLNLAGQRLDLPGLTVELETGGLRFASKFDLTVYASEAPEGLGLAFLYNADLFDEARMEALADAFAAFLEQAVSEPDRSIHAYSLRQGAAAAQLPDPHRLQERRGDERLDDLVRAAVERWPDRTAISWDDGTWSYAELAERSRSYASGLEKGSVVAVCGERGPELVAALLGILEAGAAFLILDPAYPDTRLEEIVRQVAPSSPRALPWARESRPLGPDNAAGVFWGALGPKVRASLAQGNALGGEGGSVSLAYLAFTSGSTGRPKGILGTHAPVTAFLAWYRERFGLTAADRFALLSGLAHDPLLRDVFAPLTLGARLSIPAPARLREPAPLRDWLRREAVTVLHLTPSLAELLLQGAAPGDLPSVRLAMFGGEPLTWALAARFREAAPNALCVNAYGATETPQVMACFPIEGDDLRRRDPGRVPVGWGRDGVDLLVVNSMGEPCGVGELGEIVIRSPYLSLGYLGDEALTRERFPAPDLYRTGDLGRHRPDGAVEIAGRADRQLKIRGHRVEPAEIEAALCAHPAVRDAAVVGRLSSTGETRLVAYVIPAEPSVPDLRAWLLARLPEPLVPPSIVLLDSFPLTPNGKIDRRALEQRTDSGPARGEPVPPRDAVELALVRLWEELLDVRPVGVCANFFELGGHSLLAVRLLAAVRERFGRDLPLAALFRAPTVESLAVLLREEGPLATGPLVEIQKGGTKRPLVCVHPAGGNVACYAALARALGPDQPVVGLEAQGLRPGELPRTSIEEMAAAYVEALREAQPAGPYALLGWSLGGLLAFEMARQLTAAGETVEPLLLLDTWGHPRSGEPEFPPDAEILLSVLGDPLRHTLDPQDGLDAVLAAARAAGALPPDFGREDVDRYLNVYKETIRAGQRYDPGPWPGSALLFRATDEPEEMAQDETLGWNARIQGCLTVRRVPGSHQTMITPPHVDVLGEEVKKILGSPSFPGF
jgi:amino acid adenylation domain-containing protein